MQYNAVNYHAIQSMWQLSVYKVQTYFRQFAKGTAQSTKSKLTSTFHLWYLYIIACHNITGFQPHKSMFGHEAPTACNGWLELAYSNDEYLTTKGSWNDKQHEFTVTAN